MNTNFTNGAFDTYKPLNLALPNLARNAFGTTSFPAPTGPIMSKNISAGGATPPTTQTPRNTQVSPAKDNSPEVNAMYSQVQQIMNSLPKPGYNPPSVNLKIDSTIPSSALSTVPNTTAQSEKRKQVQQNVLTSKYAAEEEQLLNDIANLRTGIANLGATQAKEYLAAEANPTGALRTMLNSDLSRLSKDQAIELNARTGQLNAYLDNLKLYQGYKPEIVGTPQLNDATGEAFVYLQDPTTGEYITQSLGQVTTPNPAANYQKVGDAIVDPTTGEVIYQAPQAGFTLGKDQVRYEYNPQTGRMEAVGYGGSSGTGMGGGLFWWNRYIVRPIKNGKRPGFIYNI